MIKTLDTTGKTIDDAIANALATLGMDRDDVTVEVLEKPKSGFLGIGSSPAKVRVSYEGPDEAPEPVKAPILAAKPAEAKSTQKPAAPAKPVPTATTRPVSASNAEKAEKVRVFLEGLLERMGAAATPKVSENEEGGLSVSLDGENLGMLIGRRGETLNAIQHVTNYVLNKGETGRTRVVVDIENYRQKREEALSSLARKTASRACKLHKNIALEPMNAYERHVIHTALQDWRDVSTFSSGAEPRRCVVVSYTPSGEKPTPEQLAGAVRESTRDSGNRGFERRDGNRDGNREGGNRDRGGYRGGNRSGSRGGDRRDTRRDSSAPQQERPKPKPLTEQVWE